MTAPMQRALVSVYDKTGIVEFCRELSGLGIQILSSGGTASLLVDNGIPVERVAEYTGFPEMLDGRVKTLHPKIHGGILAIRTRSRHLEELKREGIEPIDLVVVNLYPFEETAADRAAALEDVVEMIDIGGPAMVRAGAKNFGDVGVVVDPSDYPRVAAELKEQGALAEQTRRDLAIKAFRHTALYDAVVAGYLGRACGADSADTGFPEAISVAFRKVADLRYGENPHQRAAFYREPLAEVAGIAGAEKLQGKKLSFNNILDLDAALATATGFSQGACAIIKHGNPCGVALGENPETAFRRALECDPVSAFGSVIAFNRPVDAAVARAITEAFYEAVVAPSFQDEALEVLKKKKRLRLLAVGDLTGYHRSGFDLRRVNGGILIQDWDGEPDDLSEARVVTRRSPTEAEQAALAFAWAVVPHVKSNAIVYAREDRTIGIGAGQMSRVDSARFAIEKARSSLEGAVMASDAFFPFRDGLDVAAEAGIRAVVQPGGSIRDQEVIAAADEHDIAMVFTGRRHFRH